VSGTAKIRKGIFFPRISLDGALCTSVVNKEEVLPRDTPRYTEGERERGILLFAQIFSVVKLW